MNGPQAVRSDSESSLIPVLYLSQLCPQGLRETLHEEVVEGEVPLHPYSGQNFSMACSSWLGFLPPIGSIFTNMSNFSLSESWLMFNSWFLKNSYWPSSGRASTTLITWETISAGIADSTWSNFCLSSVILCRQNLDLIYVN